MRRSAAPDVAKSLEVWWPPGMRWGTPGHRRVAALLMMIVGLLSASVSELVAGPGGAGG